MKNPLLLPLVLLPTLVACGGPEAEPTEGLPAPPESFWSEQVPETPRGVTEGLARAADGEAVALRKLAIFKIVPFLNPDGVINGHHREWSVLAFGLTAWCWC